MGNTNPMSFTSKIYKIASKIPKGRAATYGQLAKLAGSPRAGRAVGMCMKRNPDMKIVPCHRVVGSDGKLTGYSPQPKANDKQPTTQKDKLNLKKKILLKEGVIFIGDRVNLARSLWKGK